VWLNMGKSVCNENGSSVGTSMSKSMNLRGKRSKSKSKSNCCSECVNMHLCVSKSE
jgi:hypothetical protein